jgi:phenylacetate-CoA ligase
VRQFLPHVSGELRIRLDAPPPRVEPPLRLVIEAGEATTEAEWEGLGRAIEQRIRELLTFRPSVAIVPFASLPRSGAKTRLVEIVGRSS